MSGKKGFTLIELLVVVAIIGVLASVVITSVNSARAKGRDAKRLRDIHEIQTAIEFYITDNGVSPNLGNASCLIPNTSDFINCLAKDVDSKWQVTLAAQLAPYLKKLSVDPCGATCPGATTMFDYTYMYGAPAYADSGATTTSYSIYARKLETKVNPYGFGFLSGSY